MGAVWWHSLRKLLRLATTACYLQKVAEVPFRASAVGAGQNHKKMKFKVVDPNLTSWKELGLPDRVVHIKGFFYGLDFSNPQYREVAKDLITTACPVGTTTCVVWDGDELVKDSFTWAFQIALSDQEGSSWHGEIELACFKKADNVEDLSRSFLELNSNKTVTIMTVPQTLSYNEFGNYALKFTGATEAYCLGGGFHLEEEAKANPHVSFKVWPVGRIKLDGTVQEAMQNTKGNPNVEIKSQFNIKAAPVSSNAAIFLKFLDPVILGQFDSISSQNAYQLRLSLLCPPEISVHRKSCRRAHLKHQKTISSLLRVYWDLSVSVDSGAFFRLWSFCTESLGIVGNPTNCQNSALCGSSERRLALAHFAVSLLENPTLRRTTLHQDFLDRLGSSGWAEVVGSLGSSQAAAWINRGSVLDVAVMLTNVLDLLGKQSDIYLSNVVKGLHQLIARLPLQAVEDSNDSQLKNEMEIEIDSDEEEYINEVSDERVCNLDALVRLELRKQLNQHMALEAPGTSLNTEDLQAVRASFSALMDSHMIAGFFNSVLTPGDSMQIDSQNTGAEDIDSVLALCGLYANLIMYDKQNLKEGSLTKQMAGVGIRAKALNKLALAWPNDPIVLRLWNYLSNNYDLQVFAKTGTVVPLLSQRRGEMDDSGSTPMDLQLSRALYLFCAVYSHQLLALSDADFFDRGHPLPSEAVLELVRCLGALLSRTFWTDSLVFGTGRSSNHASRLEEVYLMHAATRVFNQLYERSLRRPLCEPEEWYWYDLSDKDLLPPPAEGNLEMEDPQQWQGVYSTGKIAFLLNNIPQVIPFNKRVKIFRRLLAGEKARARQLEQQQNQGDPFQGLLNNTGTRVKIRRPFLYEDSYSTLNALGNKLKARIQVTFENEHGMEEAGIDGGGVFKEFMDAITKRAFDPQYGLFSVTSDQLVFPNPSSHLSMEEHLSHFEFAGRILGKAVFEDILVEPQFANFFLNMLLGKHNQFDDLFNLDPELYRNLNSLKEMAASGQDLSDLCLSFSVTTTDYGQNRVVNLCPDGENIPVTNENVIRYIHLMANYKLNVETAVQSRHFLKGFRDIIPVEWIRLFSPQELQLLIGGDIQRIDVDGLRNNVHYASGYHGSQPYIQSFWQIIESFTAEEQGSFLKFVTSCSRQPLLGFGHLHPKFSIQKVPAGENDSRLPSSATCMNLLKLPQYSNTEILRTKLLYSINSNAGFELS